MLRYISFHGVLSPVFCQSHLDTRGIYLSDMPQLETGPDLPPLSTFLLKSCTSSLAPSFMTFSPLTIALVSTYSLAIFFPGI